MAEEIQEQTTNDNQGVLQDVQPVPEQGGESLPEKAAEPAVEQEKTNTETVEESKPEFSDPNMQARFTERMTELSNKEKEWGTERESLAKKAKIYDILDKDPDVIAFVQRKYGQQKQQDSAISEDEIAEAQINPRKMIELIERQAKQMVKPLETNVNRVSEELQSTKLVNAINDFAVEHEDFWDLDDNGKGLIEPIINQVKFQNPDADPIAIVSEAYTRAKSIYQNIDRKNAEKYRLKTTSEINEKKNASMDSGSSPSIKMNDTKPKTMEEVFWKKAADLGL